MPLTNYNVRHMTPMNLIVNVPSPGKLRKDCRFYSVGQPGWPVIRPHKKQECLQVVAQDIGAGRADYGVSLHWSFTPPSADIAALRKYNKSLHPTGLRGTWFARCTVGKANPAPLRPAGELNRYPAMRTLVVLAIFFLFSIGCSTLTNAHDLQEVFGPRSIAFAHNTLMIDLNGDGAAERIVIMLDERRGHVPDFSNPDLSKGIIIDAFAVFDGHHPNIPVFYYFKDGGLSLRYDNIDGRQLLVSDTDRDRFQYVWGWWRYPPEEFGSLALWESRMRKWDDNLHAYGAWSTNNNVLILQLLK